jgi:hypothetical protein
MVMSGWWQFWTLYRQVRGWMVDGGGGGGFQGNRGVGIGHERVVAVLETVLPGEGLGQVEGR